MLTTSEVYTANAYDMFINTNTCYFYNTVCRLLVHLVVAWVPVACCVDTCCDKMFNDGLELTFDCSKAHYTQHANTDTTPHCYLPVSYNFLHLHYTSRGISALVKMKTALHHHMGFVLSHKQRQESKIIRICTCHVNVKYI